MKILYLEIIENIIKFHNLQKYFKIEEESSQKIAAQVILEPEQIQSSILLKLENISLVYSDRPILENVNLTIKRGDKICISGHSGSGKSSLCHILAGMIQPSSGKISYSPSIKNAKAFAIAVVPQHVPLFNQSLAFNVALGFEESSISIRQALSLASLQSLLSRYPDPETTMLGDGGVSLSGGERQRIGLARAFYRHPQILILDESTSNLDVVTEEAILETLQNYPTELTIILVTHKRKPITWINRYILVDKGKVVETPR